MKIFKISIFLLIILLIQSFSFSSTVNATSDTQTLKSIPIDCKDVTPTRTISIPVSNDVYRSGQGMCKVKNYYICSVIKTSNYHDQDISNTYIYILDLKGKIKAIVGDYCFEHANSITYDSNNQKIYITTGRTMYSLNENYIVDAIIKYEENGKKIITKNFTKKYVKKFNLDRSVSSITYDSSTKTLFGSSKIALLIITIKGNNAICKEVVRYSHINEQVTKQTNTFLCTNAGIVIKNNLLFLGRYYTDSFGNNSNIHNTIDVFKLSGSSSDNYSAKYLGTYIFTQGELQKFEIEDLQLLNENNIALYYNGKGNYNYIHELDLSKISSKISSKMFNTVLKENTIKEIKIESEPIKTEYYIGDFFSTKGLKIKLIYMNGDTKIIPFECSPIKLYKAGKQAITIKYKDKTATFNINIKKIDKNWLKGKIKTVTNKINKLI